MWLLYSTRRAQLHSRLEQEVHYARWALRHQSLLFSLSFLLFSLSDFSMKCPWDWGYGPNILGFQSPCPKNVPLVPICTNWYLRHIFWHLCGHPSNPENTALPRRHLTSGGGNCSLLLLVESSSSTNSILMHLSSDFVISKMSAVRQE